MQYISIEAVPHNFPVVVVLLAPELYIYPIIVVNGDGIKIKFVGLVVIPHICKPEEFVVFAKYLYNPVYRAITVPIAVLIAFIKDDAVV